jgi:WhiB family transcriptional regulator, redox-sensing transcriptional regulator
MDDPYLVERAACRGMDPNVFIQEGRGSFYGPARAVCGRCEVRSECLAFAVARPELVGMWGGATEAERREIRLRRVA